MKKTHLLLMLLALSLTLPSCSKDDDPKPELEKELKLFPGKVPADNKEIPNKELKMPK